MQRVPEEESYTCLASGFGQRSCQSVRRNLCSSHSSLGLAFIKSSRAGVGSDRTVGIHLSEEFSGIIGLSLSAKNLRDLASAELRF